MHRPRIIPCLLLKGNGLVKTKKFKEPTYIGDPINAVRIFSDKEVDEIIVLDIEASKKNKEPNYELLAEMAGEAFMPMTYGGGIRNLEQIRKIIRCGIEKIVINTAATVSTDLITIAANEFGSQAIVGCIDVRKSIFGKYRITCKSGEMETNLNLESHVVDIVSAGAGEILINNIDRDGLMVGYDIDLIRFVSNKVNVPVVACGGAGKIEHLAKALREGGASAVAAGSMFVFHGKHRAVLISYLKSQDLQLIL